MFSIREKDKWHFKNRPQNPAKNVWDSNRYVRNEKAWEIAVGLKGGPCYHLAPQTPGDALLPGVAQTWAPKGPCVYLFNMKVFRTHFGSKTPKRPSQMMPFWRVPGESCCCGNPRSQPICVVRRPGCSACVASSDFTDAAQGPSRQHTIPGLICSTYKWVLRMGGPLGSGGRAGCWCQKHCLVNGLWKKSAFHRC